MTSRERVLRAINFETPDRIPVNRGADSDVASVGYIAAPGFSPAKPGMNEWGCVWASLNPDAGDQGQVVEHPLAEWDAISSYRFPDPFAPGRLEPAKERMRELRAQGKFVCGSLGKGPMHLLDDLRGFENYLMDLAAEPERIETMLDGIFGFLEGMAEQYGAMGVDAVFMADDQAMQSGPLFSMEVWRERLKPRYRKLCALARSAGCKVFMHTCGHLGQHLAELADAGVDLVDNKQPALWMASPSVDAVRGNLAYSTCLDIQSTMATIDINEIEEEAGALIRRLATPRGGFVGTCYSKPDMQIPPEKNARMLEAFRRFRWADG